MFQKYSKFGIAAFFISFSTMLIMLSMIFVVTMNGYELTKGLKSSFAIILWVSLFSIPLALGSLYEPDRKKIFGILSLIWSAIMMIFLFSAVLV